MKNVLNYTQRLLFKHYNKIFFIILYGCGGVIFQKHLYELIGKRDNNLLKEMVDNRLVRINRLGKNNVIILKYAVFRLFNLPNKCVRLTTSKLIRSATVCELLLNTFSSGEVENMEKFIRSSNIPYFRPEFDYELLQVIREHFEPQYTASKLSTLDWAIKHHKEKADFIKASQKGRKEKMPEKTIKYDDFIILRNNDVYIKQVDSHGKIFRIAMVIFATNKKADKISDLILKTETALIDTFGDMEFVPTYEILSLNEKMETTEKKVFRNLTRLPENTMKEDYFKKVVIFRWYGSKNKLFSGIDIDKWL